MKGWFNTDFRAQVCLALAFFNAAIGSVISPAVSHAQAKPIRIVAFGDSLTAGYRLEPADAFPAQLQKALRERGYSVEIINAGVSGDTTAAGLERFDWAIPDNVDAAIVELGANDALRGIDPGVARHNLQDILHRLQARKIAVLLAGMRAPRNLGEDYIKRFDAMFPDLAQERGLLLYPFFLDGVALQPDLSLDDGLHPNGKGVAVIVRNIMPVVEELIARVKAKQS
jgi:acyl-CoA thioesterase-1